MELEAKSGREKCGICCIPIAARGVLDSCSDIFCFSCIDTWSAFTNLCPLCKLQFKSITFVPVADDEDSSDDETQEAFYDFLGQERAESWNVDVEEDGALSFPSYFIEEDAVVCLDGDGCRIRKGLSEEGEFGLEDTSVACDACDCWYHASCVGYKPDLHSETSWICPRCEGTGVLDLFKFQPKNFSSKVTSRNLSLSKDGSIDLLDEGETAVVVSMDAGAHSLQQSSSITMEVLKASNETLVDWTEDCMVPSARLADPSLNTKNLLGPVAQPIETATADGDLSKPAREDMEILKQASTTDSTHVLEEKSTQEVTKVEDDQKCGHIKDTDLLERSTTSPARNHCQASIEMVSAGDTAGGPCLREKQKESSPDGASSGRVSPLETADGPSPRRNQKVSSSDGVSGNDDIELRKAQKMKQGKQEDGPSVSQEKSSMKQRGPPNNLLEKQRQKKKQKLEERRADVLGSQALALRVNSDNEFSNSYQIRPMDKQKIKVEHADPIAVNEVLQVACADIKIDAFSMQDAIQPNLKVMDDLKELVQGLSPCHKRVVLPKLNTKGEDGKGEGVRTRKIVYRGSDLDGKASTIVKQMQQHLKETGMTEDMGKLDVTDEKFFVAFRAAVQSSQATARQQQASAKRAVLPRPGPKRGRSRQSLMKKLYGGTGKRRQAWDRDWDVSFWRERVSIEKNAKQSSKALLQQEMVHIEDAIRNSQKAKQAELNSLRSRVYLADTSLLPRQSDVQSLSEQISSKHNSCTVKHGKPEGLAKVGKSVFEHGTGPDTDATALNNSNQAMKMDKRKWALEVLARKTGQPERHSREKRSLLAELPQHMRPVLEYDRRSKVPTATRQVQLDRFVEFYLQKAALDSVKEDPECADAVCAAVNKEKEIYDRSNSKGVYVNLCVQALSSLPKVATQKADVVLPHEAELVLPHEAAVESAPSEAIETSQAEDMAVLMAWKATGLVSDSPPPSPIGDGKDYTSGIVVVNINGPLENLPQADVVPLGCQGEHAEPAREIPCGDESEEEARSTNSIPKVDSNAADLQEVGECALPKGENTLKEEGNAAECHGSSIDVCDQERREKILGQPGFEKQEESGGEFHGFSNNACVQDRPSAAATDIGPDEHAVQTSKTIERVAKQVEAYVKEHIRPLHRSQVITTEQYIWAVSKTTNKVMQHHTRAMSADFLIAEGEKVKRLAEQYLQLYTEHQLLGII